MLIGCIPCTFPNFRVLVEMGCWWRLGGFLMWCICACLRNWRRRYLGVSLYTFDKSDIGICSMEDIFFFN